MTTPPLSHPIELHWQPGESLITWRYGQARAGKRCREALLRLPPGPTRPSVIVVEAHQQPTLGIDNDVVFNPDGTERLRLKPPAGEHAAS